MGKYKYIIMILKNITVFIQCIIYFYSELFATEPSPDSAKMFYKVALTFSGLVADGSVQGNHTHKANTIILELARMAVTYCDKSKLPIIYILPWFNILFRTWACP